MNGCIEKEECSIGNGESLDETWQIRPLDGSPTDKHDTAGRFVPYGAYVLGAVDTCERFDESIYVELLGSQAFHSRFITGPSARVRREQLDKLVQSFGVLTYNLPDGRPTKVLSLVDLQGVSTDVRLTLAETGRMGLRYVAIQLADERIWWPPEFPIDKSR